jgi:hypothetical protein
MTAGDPSATSALALGAHPITAVCSDDANNAPSTSPVLNQLVNAPTGGATSTALSSSDHRGLFRRCKRHDQYIARRHSDG